MNQNTWQDFNDAEQQQGFDLIPKGALVKVRMTIKPGGHDDPAQGWTGGDATESFDTGIEKTVRWYLDNDAWWAPILASSDVGQRLGLKTVGA